MSFPGFPSISVACFCKQGLGPIPVWGDASVLAFPCVLFPQAVKSKADNRPDLDGALHWQPGLSGSTNSISQRGLIVKR